MLYKRIPPIKTIAYNYIQLHRSIKPHKSPGSEDEINKDMGLLYIVNGVASFNIVWNESLFIAISGINGPTNIAIKRYENHLGIQSVKENRGNIVQFELGT